jgi:hypothetical protein
MSYGRDERKMRNNKEIEKIFDATKKELDEILNSEIIGEVYQAS